MKNALCIAMLIVTVAVIGYAAKFSFGMLGFYVMLNEPIKGVIVFTVWNTSVILSFIVAWSGVIGTKKAA